jgi:stage II sporulation protein M
MTDGIELPQGKPFRFWIFLVISAGLFIAGLAIGLGFSLNSPDFTIELFEDELGYFDEIGELIEPGSFGTFILILVNNILTFFFSMLLSPILCLLPAFSLVLNGALISVVSVLVARVESVGFVMKGLLPHGILEIPAFIIAQAAALSFGFFIIASIFSPQRRARLGTDLKRSLRFFVIAVLLLIPAAIIETFITPQLLY